jgi:hypothetical protein
MKAIEELNCDNNALRRVLYGILKEQFYAE